MVCLTSARLDLDLRILKKSITFSHKTYVYDLSYGSETPTSTDYTVYAQIVINTIDNKWVTEGLLEIGDATGVLRYQYDTQVDGTIITPAIIPIRFDEITFNSDKYVIKSLTPITLPENSGVVGYNFIAKRTN